MVRIVKPHRVSRTASVTLLAAAMAAAILFLAWRFWRMDDEVVVRAAPGDRLVEWRCEAGHSFEDRGKSVERECPICGKPAFPFAIYHCPVHGPFNVSARFERDETGVIRLSQYRIEGRKWTSAKDGIRCPLCSEELEHKPIDPFARSRSGARREPAKRP